MEFQDDVVAGVTLVRPAIQSPNYTPGNDGWSINVDGSAEFTDLTIRSSDGSGNTVTIANGEFTATDASNNERVKLNFAGLTFWDDLNNVGAEIKLESTNGQAGFFARSYLIPFNTFSLLQGGRLEMGSIGTNLATSASLDLSAHFSDWSGMVMSSGRQDLADSQASLRVESDHVTGESFVQIYGDDVANFYLDGVIRRGTPSSYVDQGKGLVGWGVRTTNAAGVTTTETVGVTASALAGGNIRFEAGRAYEITVHGLYASTIAADVPRGRIRRTSAAGTILADSMSTMQIPAANNNVLLDTRVVVRNTGGSDILDVIVVTYHRIAGTGTVQMSADVTNPFTVEVRDIGLATDYPSARAL